MVSAFRLDMFDRSNAMPCPRSVADNQGARAGRPRKPSSAFTLEASPQMDCKGVEGRRSASQDRLRKHPEDSA